MNILFIVILLFVILELANIGILYFAPGTKKGNGLGVFDAYKKAKQYPEIYALVKYLIYWVAGTKLIFVLLLVVILCTGDDITKVYSVVVLIISILTFFWKLYPAIRSLDTKGQIHPRGYSTTLAIMIAVFVLMFTVALVLYFFVG